MDEAARRPPTLPWVAIAVDEYVAAFYLRIYAEGPPIDPNPEPPAPGKPPSIAFYRSIDARYERLKKEGHRSPAKQLAADLGAKEGTVKVWLHRGRRYLKRGTNES